MEVGLFTKKKYLEEEGAFYQASYDKIGYVCVLWWGEMQSVRFKCGGLNMYAEFLSVFGIAA